jgi:ribosomal protein S15
MNKHLDPYRAAQARQRKAANLSRQATLRKLELDSRGDPVRSQPTPFIQSLQPDAPIESVASDALNHYIKEDEFEHTLERSKWLTEPVSDEATKDPTKLQELLKKHSEQHENASEAMQRITSLVMGSNKDRTRLNIQRCIEEFGRHNTDSQLPPKPASTNTIPAQPSSVPIRAGPDTGSSEVQIAVLTAKINVLSSNVLRKDKHNKRNLRLLVHRRQKLLNYLRRKERGGPRWQNIVEKLGINDAMWKGEITLA